MSFFEITRFALRGISANRLRSALTTLGIMIGVAAVILLVAVGNGSSKSVQSKIEALGTNTITVLHGTSFGRQTAGQTATQSQPLTVADAAALEDSSQAPDVYSASPVLTASSQSCTYAGSTHSTSITGTWPSYFQASNSPIASGAYFSNDDVTNASRVIVIGQTVVEDLYGTVNPVGTTLTCGGVPFRVVGVLASKGSSGSSFQNADDVAIAPVTVVQRSLAGYGSLNSIVVQATSASTTTQAQSQITTILDQRHKIAAGGTADFQMLNQTQLLDATSSTNRVFTVLLASVAAISLLVGGIGITNIMLVTVTERTREIGIRKAIGASRGAILGQFLIEATILSFAGGLFGVLVGVGAARFRIVGVEPVIAPLSILLAFGVSVAIGLFFGFYPANRAAGLRPVEALRHE
jgi:putative ABC transport system permease protein